MVILWEKVVYNMRISVMGKIWFSYPADLRRSRRLQLTAFGDLFQWVPGVSAMNRRRTLHPQMMLK